MSNKAERQYNLLSINVPQGQWERSDLGEGMTIMKQCICGWWKPRYLIDEKNKRAYEIMDENERFMNFSHDDIDWDSLDGLPEKAMFRARILSAHYPSFIRKFENGVAEVSWQLIPDGFYFRDSDGFGMTDDEEITVYGFIDREMNVLVKFRYISDDWNLLKTLREQAENLKKL